MTKATLLQNALFAIKESREDANRKARNCLAHPLFITILKKKHTEEYQNAKENAEKTAPQPGSTARPKEKKIAAMNKQLTLMESLASKKIWDVNAHRSKAINEKIMMMMALDNQPFSMVEDDGFIQLMAHMQP